VSELSIFITKNYNFCKGAISRFIFLIPVPGKAISAITPERPTIVPVPNFSCFTRSPSPRDPADTVCFSTFGLGADDVENPEKEDAPLVLPKRLDQYESIAFREKKVGAEISYFVMRFSGISLRNRDAGFAE